MMASPVSSRMLVNTDFLRKELYLGDSIAYRKLRGSYIRLTRALDA